MLIASGPLTFSAASRHKLKIKLTRAGKRLLRQVSHRKLTAKGSFKPPGLSAISALKLFPICR